MNTLCKNLILHERIMYTGKSIPMFLLKYFSSNTTGVILEDVMDKWRTKFEKSNIPEANISTQLIASHILQVADMSKLDHYLKLELDEDQIEEFNRCGECRLARMPLQYIIKQWDFRDTKLELVPPVFIPRPETEMLIDVIADHTNDIRRGLEIGCGCGAVSIALLKKFPDLHMDAIDQSKVACNLTSTNAMSNDVQNRLNIFNGKIEEDGNTTNYKIESSIDFIVSNPPYLFTAELFQLEPEVKLYEDLRALDGGRDGLRVIKSIFLFSSKVLARSKNCFVEVHHRHTPMIQKWLETNSHLNLNFDRGFKDIFGQDRFVCVVKQ